MNFSLPRFDDVVDTIAASKAVYFTVLDLASGFRQIPVSESSKEKTCFVTESGTYCYKRMPFDVVNASSVFSMVMSEILRSINWIHALVYVDDIVVFSRSLEEHQQHLQDVFDRLKEAGLKLNPSKCHFAAKKVTYLGHNFSKEGVSVDTSKTECVAFFPITKNHTDVISFFDLATYYKRFVKGFSHIAAPLCKCDILIRHYIMHKHVYAENEMLLLFFYVISVSISVYLKVYPLMLLIYTCVLYIYILISHRDKCTMCKYDIKD